ncbi:MAG: phage pre-tape measure protein [Janthinobacterium lividum]
MAQNTDFAPATRTVRMKDRKPLTFRGLSLSDVVILVRTHTQDMITLVDLFDQAGSLPALMASREKMIPLLMMNAPQIAADIITMAEVNNLLAGTDFARTLPLPIQVMALKEIAELTFEDVGGPKAFLSVVMAVVDNLRPSKPATTEKASSAGSLTS